MKTSLFQTTYTRGLLTKHLNGEFYFRKNTLYYNNCLNVLSLFNMYKFVFILKSVYKNLSEIAVYGKN